MKLPKQISLSNTLLLTACIAVWIAYHHNRSRLETLRLKLEATKLLAHELVVDDTTRLSIVHQEPLRFDEEVWQVFVPADNLQLNMATTDLPEVTSPVHLPKDIDMTSVTLPAGRHRLELKSELIDDQWHIRIELNHKEMLQRVESKAWNDTNGSYGGHTFSQQEDFDPTQDAILFHRVFSVKSREGDGSFKTQPHPNRHGVLLWISPKTSPH